MFVDVEWIFIDYRNPVVDQKLTIFRLLFKNRMQKDIGRDDPDMRPMQSCSVFFWLSKNGRTEVDKQHVIEN